MNMYMYPHNHVIDMTQPQSCDNHMTKRPAPLSPREGPDGVDEPQHPAHHACLAEAETVVANRAPRCVDQDLHRPLVGTHVAAVDDQTNRVQEETARSCEVGERGGERGEGGN